MTMDYQRRAIEHFKRGVEHLESGEEIQLCYAALEMRLAIEAIVYKKCEMLGNISENLPKSVWQPRQLLQFIEQLDPTLNSDVKISIVFVESKDTPPPSDETQWHHLAESKEQSVDGIRKIHSNLGNYLHVTRASPDDMRRKLPEIKDKIESLVYSSHVAIPSRLVTSKECVCCGKQLIYSEQWFERGGIIRCMQEGCGAEYEAKPESNQLNYLSACVVPCGHCPLPIEVTKKLLVGYVNALSSEEKPLKLKCKCGKTTSAHFAVGY